MANIEVKIPKTEVRATVVQNTVVNTAVRNYVIDAQAAVVGPQGPPGEQSCYLCTYDSTQYDDITRAIRDKMIPAVVNDNMILMYNYTLDSKYYFTTLDQNNAIKVITCDDNSVWQTQTIPFSTVAFTGNITDLVQPSSETIVIDCGCAED